MANFELDIPGDKAIVSQVTRRTQQPGQRSERVQTSTITLGISRAGDGPRRVVIQASDQDATISAKMVTLIWLLQDEDMRRYAIRIIERLSRGE